MLPTQDDTLNEDYVVAFKWKKINKIIIKDAGSYGTRSLSENGKSPQHRKRCVPPERDTDFTRTQFCGEKKCCFVFLKSSMQSTSLCLCLCERSRPWPWREDCGLLRWSTAGCRHRWNNKSKNHIIRKKQNKARVHTFVSSSISYSWKSLKCFWRKTKQELKFTFTFDRQKRAWP